MIYICFIEYSEFYLTVVTEDTKESSAFSYWIVWHYIKIELDFPRYFCLSIISMLLAEYPKVVYLGNKFKVLILGRIFFLCFMSHFCEQYCKTTHIGITVMSVGRSVGRAVGRSGGRSVCCKILRRKLLLQFWSNFNET